MTPLDITVRRTTAAQQVAEGLSDLIMSGHFPPGTRLRESAIAAELKISRNTVREAVRVLELGGLVRHEVNLGAVVISPTPDGVRALYKARGQLEVAAARQSRTSADLEPARLALKRLEEAADTHQVHDIVAADLLFHAAIVSILGSSRIDDFYTELTTELRFYLTVLSVEDREFDQPAFIVAEHVAILLALESDDHDDAVRAIQSHIDVNAERVCQILLEREGTDRHR